MVNELAFKTRTVLNVLVLASPATLTRARHLGRRVWVPRDVLTVLAIPALVIVWAIESTIREVVNILVLIAWLMILRSRGRR